MPVADAPKGAEPVGRRVAVASLYMVATRLTLRGLGFFSTLILVRILSPDDFGLVGLAAGTYAILDTLTATGFNLAIIRMRDPEPRHYDTAWTMNVLRGLVIASALALTARLQAEFMGDARIAGLMWLLAGTAILQSLESIRLVDRQRELRFETIMLYNVVGKISSFCIVLPLAFIMRNYWPLVLSIFFSRLFVTIPLSYVLAPYRPRLTLAGWHDLFHFSKWLTLGNLCSVIDLQMMNFIVGRFVGMQAVGLFQVTNQIAALPISEIAAPIRQPVYAGFSKIHHDIEQLRQNFFRGFELQWIVILPLSLGISVTASDVTAIFLGQQWTAAVPLLPVIALYALVDAISAYTHNLFIVTDRQRIYTLTYYAAIAIRLPITIAATMDYGLMGAALAMLVTSGINTLIWMAQVKPVLNAGLRDFLRVSWRVSLSGGVLCAAVLGTSQLLPVPTTGGGELAVFATKVAVGAAAYFLALLGFWLLAGAPADSGERELLRQAKHLLVRRRLA